MARSNGLGASSGHPEPARGASSWRVFSTTRSSHLNESGSGPGTITAGQEEETDQMPTRASLDHTYPLTPTPMTRRKMRQSPLVACLPICAGLASALLVYPNCSGLWDWASNSLGQNPCNVAAYLEDTCGHDLFHIPPIPPGAFYSGPNAGEDTSCQCSTVTYSLISACGACQGSTWTKWSEWSFNCITVSSAGTYPNTIPAGTRIPHWAYLDVSVTDNWSATAAKSAGAKDTPEQGPEGTVTTSVSASPTSASASSTSESASSTSGSSSSTSPSSSPKQKSSNTVAIAGGVGGGVLGLTLVVSLIAYFTRRRRRRAVARPSYMTDGPHMDEAFGIPEPSISPPIHKYYDPSDPSTFPSTFPTSFESPLGTVIQNTPGSEQLHNLSMPSISTYGRNQYTGLPLL